MKSRASFGSLLLLACLSLCAVDVDENAYWDERFGVPGAPHGITSIVFIKGQLYIAGNLVSVDGVPVMRIAKWDGTNWTDAAYGDFEGSLVCTLATDGQNLYAGGTFTRIGGVPVSNIAKWDGTNWSALGAGVSGGSVSCLSVGGTSLYAGGDFRTAGGISANNVARWNGKNWFPLGNGVARIVRRPGAPPFIGSKDESGVAALQAHKGDLFAAGSFDVAGDVGAVNIARWDGTNWHSLGAGLRRDPSTNASGVVFALTMDGDNLIAGGDFSHAGDILSTNIACWNGANWRSLAGGVNDGLSISAVLAANSRIFAGGVFQSIGGVAASKIAQWDGERWSPLGSGVNAGSGEGVEALVSDGMRLFVGGQFRTLGNKPSTNIGIWHFPRTLGIERVSNTVAISWPQADADLRLYATPRLTSCPWRPWQIVTNTPVLEQQRWVVEEPINESTKFYQLRE